MAERMTRKLAWSFAEYVLTTAVVAEKGGIACFDLSTAGEVCGPKTDTDLVPIGYFEENMTGDGTTKVRIRLFKEKILHQFPNDGTDAVAAADIGGDCYLTAAGAASSSSATNTRSKLGRVWGVDATYGVIVEPVA